MPKETNLLLKRVGWKWIASCCSTFGGPENGGFKYFGAQIRQQYRVFLFIVAATLWCARVSLMLPRFATCEKFVTDTNFVSWTQKSATRNNVAMFSQDWQHRRLQCCCHNVSSFCQGLNNRTLIHKSCSGHSPTFSLCAFYQYCQWNSKKITCNWLLVFLV